MTIKIALTGKSGVGKTTITKAFLDVLKNKFSDKSILLFDNDLSGELAHSYGLDIRNTIYGIRTGKHEYKTGIPQHMTKQEYIEWALEDIVVSIDDNVDIIESWLVGVKDCRCPITEQLNSALKKMISRYDFVIFDCEFDLKYLVQLVDIDIDLTLIICNPNLESINLAKRISEYSAKYAVGGQMGIIVNKVNNDIKAGVYNLTNDIGIDIIGILPLDDNIKNGSVDKKSEILNLALSDLYCHLNLPQENVK